MHLITGWLPSSSGKKLKTRQVFMLNYDFIVINMINPNRGQQDLMQKFCFSALYVLITHNNELKDDIGVTDFMFH